MGKPHHLVRSMSIYFGDFPDFLFKTTQIFRDFPLISQAFPPQGLPMDFPRDFRGFHHLAPRWTNSPQTSLSSSSTWQPRRRKNHGENHREIFGKTMVNDVFFIYGIIIYLWWLGLFICYNHDGLWWTLLDYSNILWLMMGKASYHVEHRW